LRRQASSLPRFQPPAVVAAGGDNVGFLNVILADIHGLRLADSPVETEAARILKGVSQNIVRIRFPDEGIVRLCAVTPPPELAPQRLAFTGSFSSGLESVKAKMLFVSG
jgi:hypothetical protein